MSALQLNNATPPKASSNTSMPSFDDLMKSLQLSGNASQSQVEPSQHSTVHHSPHHHSHPHPHAHVHPQPYPNHHHHPHLHQSPHHSPHAYPQRPPSTPPTPRSQTSDQSHDHAKHTHHRGHHVGRPRSSSVPSLSRTHLTSPFRDVRGISPALEHHADRVQSLKEGDGEWASYSLNAVAPSSLPYHARPHYRPRQSTGSIPTFSGIHPASLSLIKDRLSPGENQSNSNFISQMSTCSPLHHPHHSYLSHCQPLPAAQHQSAATTFTISTNSSSNTLNGIPIPTPIRPNHHRAPSLGLTSHSPLSTSEPLTPSSFQAMYDTIAINNMDMEVDMNSESNGSETSRTSTPTPAPAAANKVQSQLVYGTGLGNKAAPPGQPAQRIIRPQAERAIRIPSLPKLS